jgi:glycosyltransferase involved in cell wall biosynthesis
MTSNSFVDASFFPKVELTKKINRVVHLGRFHPGKRIDKFILALPEVDSLLKERGILDAEYIILGYGTLEEAFREMLVGYEYKDIKYKIYFTPNPQEELIFSRIILSIQEKNNYPSRALLEGMACGNIPLVTDVGTTRKIADPSFSYFLNPDFQAKDLAEKIFEVLSLEENEFQKKAKSAIRFVEDNFTIEKMSDYYFQLYKKFID